MIEIVVELMIWTWTEIKLLLYLFFLFLFSILFTLLPRITSLPRENISSSSQNATLLRILARPKTGHHEADHHFSYTQIIIPWGQNSYCGSIIATPKRTPHHTSAFCKLQRFSWSSSPTLNALVLGWSLIARMVRVPGAHEDAPIQVRGLIRVAPKNRTCREE